MYSTSDQTQSMELDSVGSTDVAASCGEGSVANVTVSWKQDHSELADGYEVLRRDANGDFVSVGTVSVSGDSYFSDDKVAPGATYTYAVRALNSAWGGQESETVPVTIPSCV
jgi:hypothetical protein